MLCKVVLTAELVLLFQNTLKKIREQLHSKIIAQDNHAKIDFKILHFINNTTIS